MLQYKPESCTALVFGIIVSNESLANVAYWFPRLRGALRFLDLIVMRKKLNNLQHSISAQGGKNFGDLPVEIIKIIKQEVIDADIESYDEEGFGYDDYWPNRGVKSSQVKSLLEYNGLELSTMNWITKREEDDKDWQRTWDECYSAISIPIQNYSLDSRTNYDYDGNPIYSPQLLHFDPSTIDTTVATTRFTQLVKEWNLKMYDDSIQVMGELKETLEVGEEKAGLEGQEDENNLIVKKRVEINVEKVEIEPRWMIISHTRLNYLF